MPVGYPRDPVAHAAILAANREAKAKVVKHGKRTYRRSTTPSENATVVAASSGEVQPVKKRTYKSRKTATPKEVYAVLADEGNTVVTAPGTMIKVLEEKIDELTWENERLKKNVEASDRRLMTLLDLISKANLA